MNNNGIGELSSSGGPQVVQSLYKAPQGRLCSTKAEVAMLVRRNKNQSLKLGGGWI